MAWDGRKSVVSVMAGHKVFGCFKKTMFTLNEFDIFYNRVIVTVET